jgi:methyl-accepting chemotaxis protein
MILKNVTELYSDEKSADADSIDYDFAFKLDETTNKLKFILNRKEVVIVHNDDTHNDILASDEDGNPIWIKENMPRVTAAVLSQDNPTAITVAWKAAGGGDPIAGNTLFSVPVESKPSVFVYAGEDSDLIDSNAHPWEEIVLGTVIPETGDPGEILSLDSEKKLVWVPFLPSGGQPKDILSVGSDNKLAWIKENMPRVTADVLDGLTSEQITQKWKSVGGGDPIEGNTFFSIQHEPLSVSLYVFNPYDNEQSGTEVVQWDKVSFGSEIPVDGSEGDVLVHGASAGVLAWAKDKSIIASPTWIDPTSSTLQSQIDAEWNRLNAGPVVVGSTLITLSVEAEHILQPQMFVCRSTQSTEPLHEWSYINLGSDGETLPRILTTSTPLPMGVTDTVITSAWKSLSHNIDPIQHDTLISSVYGESHFIGSNIWIFNGELWMHATEFSHDARLASPAIVPPMVTNAALNAAWKNSFFGTTYPGRDAVKGDVLYSFQSNDNPVEVGAAIWVNIGNNEWNCVYNDESHVNMFDGLTSSISDISSTVTDISSTVTDLSSTVTDLSSTVSGISSNLSSTTNSLSSQISAISGTGALKDIQCNEIRTDESNPATGTGNYRLTFIKNAIVVPTDGSVKDIPYPLIAEGDASKGTSAIIVPSGTNDNGYRIRVSAVEASDTQTGVMPASSFAALEQALSDISTLKGSSRRYVTSVELVSNTNTQVIYDSWLTATNQTAGGGSYPVPPDGTTMISLNEDSMWNAFSFIKSIYDEAVSGSGGSEVTPKTGWVYRGTDTVQTASTNVLGIVKGVDTNGHNGKIFVESDGSMSLIGYDSIGNSITSLNLGVERLDTDVGTLKTDVGTLKTDVSTLKTNIGTESISDLRSNITELQASVNSLSGLPSNVDTLSESLNDLVETVGELSSNVTGLSSLLSEVNTLKAKINKISEYADKHFVEWNGD